MTEEKNTINQPGPAPRPPVSETSSLPPSRRRFQPGLLIFAVLAVVVIAAAIYYYIHFVTPYETTDDAFIDGYVTFVSPRVSGPVVQLLVTDNQHVNAGDVLVEIDPHDYQVVVDQAKADLATAQSRVQQAEALIPVDQAKAEQQNAAIASALAITARAEADRVRFESVQSRAVSATQVDLAKAQAKSTSAEVEVARAQAKAALAQVELDRAAVQTAREPGRASRHTVGTGAIATFLHNDYRAAERAGCPPHRRAGRVPPNRPGAPGPGARRCLGRGQFQGNAIGADASRPAG